jgi:hypothetical protein
MCHAVSTLINNSVYNLHMQLLKSLQYISDDRRAYETIFNILYYSVTGRPLTEAKLSGDPRFVDVLSTSKKFLDNILRIYDKYGACIPNIASEVFDSVLYFLKRSKGLKHFVFCDGMSITEALYLAGKLGANSINVIINPGGVTETYKFILGPGEYMAKQPNLDAVVGTIAKKAGASHTIFREYDETIHKIGGSEGLDPRSIVEKMYNITLRLESTIHSLKKEGVTVVLLSDHGYDVVSVDSGKFKTQHRWGPRSLSILAPVMIIDPSV